MDFDEVGIRLYQLEKKKKKKKKKRYKHYMIPRHCA